MIVNVLVKMWCILVLCPVLLAAAAQTLSIDSQLGTSIEDCFERISIGEQLPPSAIYRNVSELTTKECEQICKQDKQCQAYDYGVGAKGNATCDLSNKGEKELREKNYLSRHPDYDVYVRRFQCEQSPPSPLQPQAPQNDEGEGPFHRPVFRPEIDEPKRPLADDFSPDLRPFETTRPDSRPYPPYRPYKPPYLNNVDRPDDYINQRPNLDRPPSYGLHRPQDIPYRPERPYNNSYSDPYDILQFQDQRPQYPGSWRPDPHYPPSPVDDVPDIYGPKPNRPRPDLPPFRPENPEYVYITRPNRRPPRPLDDPVSPGYGHQPNKPLDYPIKPDPYAPNDDPRPPYKPNRPADYPYRPNDRPSYNYNSQYASNYGQNQYNDDNSIYVEIYDPPRPYRPGKPDRPMYGSSQSYGQGYGYEQSFGGSYGQSSLSQSQSQHYGSSSISHLDNYNRPQDPGQRPYKPEDTSPGYGLQDSFKPENPYHKPNPIYGPPTTQDFSQKPGYGQPPPQDITQKPTYGSSSPGYGSTSSSYGSSQSSQFDQSYGSQSSSYGSQKPQDNFPKPGYNEKPAYDKPSYGTSQSSYGNQGSYASSQDFSNGQGYGSQSSYGGGVSSFQDHHTSQQSSYGGASQSFGGYQEGYGNHKPERPYVNRPSYEDNRPLYKPPSYGSRPSINDRPTYDRPSYGEKPSYDNRPSYGQDPSFDRPSYNDRPTYDKPSYDRPQDIKPSYDKPLESPGYGTKPSYDKPGYGSQSFDKPSYGSKPGYGEEYDNNRPDGEPGYGSDTSGYGEDYKNAGKPKPNRTDGYKPDIKPVYEYEVERPNGAPSYIVRPSGEVITSRPVTIGDYGRPGHGREPPVSYKACFRRVLAGKRALRSFVRRVVPCERLEDCRRECAEERRFHCESFNYKLDPSFRGKGLCEMMTKPIEAFDLRRDFVEDKDYDFYELDRNSLEPHCPETLRGPGLLHSGFLSSKPDRESYQSWDRNDWTDQGLSDRKQFYDDRRFGGGNGGGRRRYEDQFFVPYQIGLARSNDDQENWGSYGGIYGGDSYYKDRNEHHKSISHWGFNDLDPPAFGVRPLGPQNFNYHDLGKKVDKYGYGAWKRGRWNSSGASWNGLDYGETTYFKPPKPLYYEPSERSNEESDEVLVKDCSSRRRPGMSLGSGSIRRALLAHNVVQCEAACFGEREFKCVSYSYRYSNSHGSDNCFLSERPYRGVELSTDSGSDVYAMPEHQGCSVVSNKPLIESECFWHVRSGAAVSGTAVRAALTVAGLGACEAECIRAQGFFCRGFSFRFDSPTIGDDLENCVLTSTPPTSLDSGRGLRPNAGHELYSRGNYGRGCEPALYDDVQHKETGECYLQYDNAAKLIGSAVKGHARVRDEQACGQACTDAPFRCLSFSFNNNAAPDTDNCLLSEIRLFDLQRGVDYEHSTDDWLFAFDLFNGQCWRKVHGRSDYDDPVPELPRPLSVPAYPPGPSAAGPSGSAPSGPTGYLPAAPPGPTGYLPAAPPGPTGYLPAAPPAEPYLPASGPPSGPAYKPHPRPDPDYSAPGYGPVEPPGYPPSGPTGPYRPSGPPGPPRPSSPGYLPTGTAPGYGPSGPFRPSGPPGPTGPHVGPPSPPRPYPDTSYGPPPEPPGVVPRPGDREEEPIVVSWRHYTVSGFPCRQGTSCAQNHVAGHWACEPEGGEVGSWDYCCAPTHRCGYSEGFHKPWCYVGPSQDQWRPCSEKYYPYHQHNIPHPSQQGHRGDGPRPPIGPPVRPYNRPGHYLPEADRRYWDELYKNGPQAYYDKYGNPLPGYTRVPMAERPHIKYQHHYPQPASGHWVPVPALQSELDPPVPGGLGAPRYWPVAYLHKGPPPNITYFRYNQTDRPTPNHIPTTTEKYDRYDSRPRPAVRDFRDPPSNSQRDFDRDFRDRNQNRDYPNVRRDQIPTRDYPNDRRDSNLPRDYPSDRRNGNTPSDYPNNRRDSDIPRDYPSDRRDSNIPRDYPSDRRNSNTPSDRRESNLPRDYPTDRRDSNDPRDYPNDRRDSTNPSERDSPTLTPRDRSPTRPSLTNNNQDRPPNSIESKSRRDEKTRNITNLDEDTFNVSADKVTTTTPKVEVKEVEVAKEDAKNASEVEIIKVETEKPKINEEFDNLKGIDDKIDDFSKSIEVLDIEDAKKGEKIADLKMLEAEERQIEAIGRLLAARRGGKLVLEKRSQKDLETKSIALDKDSVDFNFGNRFPTGTAERRGKVQRVTKEELEKEKNVDKSLEVSETTFVRPPRVLSTTENIRKAIVNGKVFYSASVREQRDLLSSTTRKPKSLSLRPLEERAPSVLANTSYGKKKVVRTRNVNPVRKVRRVYRRKYNPEEVRRRLLERERSMKENSESKKG